jgi:FkbM family methyltransferase
MKKITNFLKQLTYRSELSRVVWRLHLAKIFRQIYFWINKPASGLINIKIGEVEANFITKTPWQLRALEPAGQIGHEKHILELLVSKLSSGDVVCDVGASFGVFAVLLAKAVGPTGKVIAIEPEKQTYNLLQENIKINFLTNISSFNIAFGDYNGENKLFLGQVPGASSLMKKPGEGEDTQKINVVEGDKLIKENNLPVPKLIKIDVEGYEYAVINGLKNTLLNPKCKIVCCEIHSQFLPNGIKPEDILTILKSLGFNNIDSYSRGTTEYHIIAQK